MIAGSDVPKRNDRVAARVVEGKALIVVIDQQQLHRLSPVATRIWELCDGRDVDAIASALVAEFEVDSATAHADVVSFLSELRALDAIALEPQR